MTVSSKIRIYDLAKELKLDTRRLIEEVRREGVDVSVPSNSVPKQVANRLREKYLPKQIARNERGTESIHRSLGGLVPKEDLPKQALPPKTGPKLFFRPFIGPLGRNSNSTDVVRTELNRQTPWKTTSQTPTEHNQSGRKVVSRSLQKRRNTVKRKPMLFYEPPKKVPAKPRHKPLHKKQYICSICATSCSSKPLLRAHMVSTHMNEIMAGRAQTRVTAYELCRAIHADLQALIAVARSLGHKIKNESDYLSPGIVKELVFKIQNAASKQIGEKHDESIPTTEVLRSKTGLKSEIFEKLVKKEFGELRELIDDCLKGRQVRAGDEWLVSNDSTVLLEYARILESEVRGASPDSFRRRIVKRIFDDLAVYRERGGSFGAKRLRWRLLPPGRQPFDKLVQHFHNLSRKEPRIVFDIVRLHKAYSLNPDEVFVGTEEFEGYVVFYFAQAHTAVLDCPVTGNAIYVFGENWRSLSHLTKSALLSRQKDSVRRIVHNGAWFSRLKSLLATRRLQAGVRQ